MLSIIVFHESGFVVVTLITAGAEVDSKQKNDLNIAIYLNIQI